MRLLIVALICMCGIASVAAQAPPRPKILGIAHVALYVHDLEKARAFYTGLLGYEQAFEQQKPDGTLDYIFLKVNDRQYIQLLPETQPGTDRLGHIALETDSGEGMRAWLKANNVKVPDKVSVGAPGHLAFMIKDPEGHSLEFIQYQPTGPLAEARGKFLSQPTLSRDLSHAGVLMGELAPALAFYQDVLGFSETWRGSRDEKVLNWVNLKASGGENYIEFMLYDALPAPDKRGSQHHLSLYVPDVAKALGVLKSRAAAAGYTQALEIKTGINKKRQLNLFDPDGTRVELMEPNTVDGKPVPSSTAKPPK